MANKTYFKGKKKSTVKSKKYQFAGFDEATQIDNTGYLNALYNPKYFDTTAVSNETIQKNIDQTINTSKQSSADYAADKEANKQSLLNLTARRKQAQEEEKASMRNMAEQTAQQYTAKNVGAITGLTTQATKFGVDLVAKKAAEKTAATAANLITPTVATNVGANAANAGVQAGISGTNLLYSGLGTLGVVGGEAWKYFSDDKNPYTYKPSEAAGTIGGNTLSWAGTGAGIGTAIMPGVGTLIGAGIGALGGLTVGLVQNRKKKKMAASLESERAEQEADWNAQKAEYDKYLGQRQRVYDYNQRVARTGMTTLAEQSRQNRLMGLTEGQLAGNTNIAMTGGGRKYFGKGGVNVPGGQVVPIGQGAVEFVGRKHSQGGIMLDPQTEVEGGETMDKVMMTGGKFNDYFFSDYLKNGGKSFAQHHKELIKKGASQKEIQALAKKQEAMANRKGEKDRSPNQVAKYGGIKKYQTGKFKETEDTFTIPAVDVIGYKSAFGFPYPLEPYQNKNKLVTEKDVEEYNAYLKNNQGERNIFYDTHDLIQDKAGNYSWQTKRNVDYQSAIQGTPLGQMVYKTFSPEYEPVDQFKTKYKTLEGLEMGYSPYNIWASPSTGIGFYDKYDPGNILNQVQFAAGQNAYPTIYFLNNTDNKTGDLESWYKTSEIYDPTERNIFNPDIEQKTGMHLMNQGYDTIRVSDTEFAKDPKYIKTFGYDDDLLRIVNPEMTVAGALPLNKRIVNKLERMEKRFDSQDFDKQLRKEERVKKMLLRKAGLPRTEENLKTLMHYNFTPLDVYSEINKRGYKNIYSEQEKTGGLRKYFTGGVKKYKTAGSADDPTDPLIMTAIVRLGTNDPNLSNYRKVKTNEGIKIQHTITGKEIFFDNNEIKNLTSSKNTYGAGEATLRAASEEEMKQMQSDTNPSFWDYAKGVYNVITNPLDAIQYENTRGNIMDDPANWLRMVEMDQQNNPNPVNELLELAPSVMSMGAAGPKYTVTMTPKAPNFGLGTGSAIPKSSLSRAYDLARPTFTRSPIMVPRVTAKQPAGTTVTTGAQRIAARNSGSTAVGNRFYDNRYYGRGDFWGQNLPPEVTVSGTASRKINIPSYTIKPPLAGFAGGYMGPFGEDFINYTTNPEYIGQYGTILNTGNNRNTGSNGSTENVDYNTGEYYKTDEERKAAEKIRQKVADYWASGYSGSTGRGGTGTSAGYTQSATSAAPPFTGSLALGTGNSNSTKGQTKTDDKKDDKKGLNMPEGKKEAIPFNRDLANRLALLQIGAGLPSIIPPLIALGKDIPTPNWDPFTYNRIPSVGGAPAITAGSVAAPRLSRVDYSDKMTRADEMALAAMNKSAEAGPQSGILNMAILGKNYRQILELQKQEADENKKQSDIEKQLAAKVSEGNRDAAMSAASKNAENILKTNDINSAINQANLGAELKRYDYISQKNDLEYRKNIEKYLTDLSALETLAGIPMQIASDTAKTYSDQYLAYLASDPTSGVYDRYINAMLGREDKKKTGGIKKYTSRLGDLVKNPKLKSKII